MGAKEVLIKIFENYYQQAFNDPSYRVNVESNTRLIEDFYRHLDKHGYVRHSIGENFLKRFLLLQFDYYITKDLKVKPQINWFIGKKAIDRFFAVEDWEQKLYFVSQSTKHLTDYEEPKKESEYEIRIKKKQDIVTCVQNTSLYSKCLPCITCKHKLECQKMLKQNYPLLWKRRMVN